MIDNLHCRRCGNRITSAVEKCPSCGYPTKHGQAAAAVRLLTRRRLFVVVGVFLVLFALLLLWQTGTCA